MADVKPSDITVTRRITNAYRLMLSARRNGETEAERTYMQRIDNLLEQIPRDGRF